MAKQKPRPKWYTSPPGKAMFPDLFRAGGKLSRLIKFTVIRDVRLGYQPENLTAAYHCRHIIKTSFVIKRHPKDTH